MHCQVDDRERFGAGEEREREREKPSYRPQATGHMAVKATWPMEGTGEYMIGVQVMSKQATSKKIFLFVPMELY